MKHTKIRSIWSLRCIRIVTATLAANDGEPFERDPHRFAEIAAHLHLPSQPSNTSDWIHTVLSWLACEFLLQRSALHFQLCDRAASSCWRLVRATLSWTGPQGKRSTAISCRGGLLGTQSIFRLPAGTHVTAVLHLQGRQAMTIDFLLPPRPPPCAP